MLGDAGAGDVDSGGDGRFSKDLLSLARGNESKTGGLSRDLRGVVRDGAA